MENGGFSVGREVGGGLRLELEAEFYADADEKGGVAVAVKRGDYAGASSSSSSFEEVCFWLPNSSAKPMNC